MLASSPLTRDACCLCASGRLCCLRAGALVRYQKLSAGCPVSLGGLFSRHQLILAACCLVVVDGAKAKERRAPLIVGPTKVKNDDDDDDQEVANHFLNSNDHFRRQAREAPKCKVEPDDLPARVVHYPTRVHSNQRPLVRSEQRAKVVKAGRAIF